VRYLHIPVHSYVPSSTVCVAGVGDVFGIDSRSLGQKKDIKKDIKLPFSSQIFLYYMALVVDGVRINL
jgi:hypothetical protein